MVDLGYCADRAFVSTSAGALFDRDGGRKSSYRVNLWTR